MSKKIVVIQMKEIIYTAVFAALGILLIILLIFMFIPKNNSSKSSENTDDAKYVAGVYTSQITLNDTILNIETVVDENHINSVRLVNLDETVTTMYPLIKPTIEEISKQLCNDVDIDDIIISENSKYTQLMLIDEIKHTLDKAKLKKD